MTSQGLATPTEVADFMHTSPGKLANDRSLGIGIPFVKFNRKFSTAANTPDHWETRP